MVLLIVASHVAALALALYSLRTSGVGVQVVLYAFVIDYVLRLCAIAMLHAEMRGRDRSWIGAVAPFVSRPPRPHETSDPVREGEHGPPARLGTYLFVMAFLGALAFVLATVGPDRTLRVAPGGALDDWSWAIAIGTLYWVNSLLTRSLVIDPSLTLPQNLGYNTREVTVLALSVLTAAVIVVYRQNAGLPATPWTVMGPLLVWRFIHELWASLGVVRAQRAAQ